MTARSEQDAQTRGTPDAAGSRPVASASASASVSARSALLLLLVTLAWVVWRTGPAPVPGIEGLELAARGWPTIPTGPDTAYVLRVPLGYLVYGLLPWEGPVPYMWMSFVALLVFFALLTWWLCRSLGTSAGLVATSVVALAPITAVQLHWIGIYDPFSLLVWLLVLVALRHAPPWQLLAAVVAGAQNFEQVVVGILLLLLVPRLAAAAGLRPRALWLLAGAVVGKVALEAYLGAVGATPGSRLSYLLESGTLDHLLKTTVANGPVIVWSALAGLWGFALLALTGTWATWSRSERLRLAAALVAWFGACAITADHTRVLALTSFPVVVAGAMVLADRRRDVRELVRTPLAWMLFLAPPVVVFDYIELPMGLQPGAWGFWVF